MTQPTFINLYPNEYSQEFRYYPFAVKLDRCVGSSNTAGSKCSKQNIRFKSKHVLYYYRNK